MIDLDRRRPACISQAMKLTASNLERHKWLFAETGPNRGVIVRARPHPGTGGGTEICAEKYKLLEDDRENEGWTRAGWYGTGPVASIEDLLAECPELGRMHFVPSDFVELW